MAWIAARGARHARARPARRACRPLPARALAASRETVLRIHVRSAPGTSLGEGAPVAVSRVHGGVTAGIEHSFAPLPCRAPLELPLRIGPEGSRGMVRVWVTAYACLDQGARACTPLPWPRCSTPSPTAVSSPSRSRSRSSLARRPQHSALATVAREPALDRASRSLARRPSPGLSSPLDRWRPVHDPGRWPTSTRCWRRASACARWLAFTPADLARRLAARGVASWRS